MPMLTKICGLTRPRDIETAIECGADYLGFIIEAQSPRRLSVAQARKLTAPITDITPCVAVTVNPSQALISEFATCPAFKFIQLHGNDITPDLVHWIHAHTQLRVIRSVAMRNPSDISVIKKFVRVADKILLDAPAPKNSTQEGGHGTAFDWFSVDWTHIRQLSQQTQIGLAGGLNPDNIAKAKAVTGLSFFDVSSGIEASAGVKDPLKIRDFIYTARLGGSEG